MKLLDKVAGGWRNWEMRNGAASVTMPQNAAGMLAVGELLSTLTTATTYSISIPNGINGMKIKMVPMVSAPLARVAYVAFNNTAFNDVTIVGLRRLVTMGDSESFVFTDTGAGSLPTVMTIVVDAPEVATGDSLVYFEAVQKS